MSRVAGNLGTVGRFPKSPPAQLITGNAHGYGAWSVDRFEDVQKQSRHKRFGDWLRCAWRGDRKRLEDVYQTKAVLDSNQGVAGGYTVPLGFSKGILTVVNESSLFLTFAEKIPLATHETAVPHVDVTKGASATSAAFGGVRFIWGNENVALTETEPAFQSTTLVAHTLAGYALVSNQMMADAEEGELGKYLEDLLGKAAAWEYDYRCFQGNGEGQPLGILNAPAVANVSRGGPGDVKQVDLAEMMDDLLPCGWQGLGGPEAIWCLHPTAAAKLMAESTWFANMVPPLAINSLRAYPTEKLNVLGSVGDVVLFIPKLYLCGIRQEVEVSISRDEPTAFKNNQSVIRVTFRADGRPRLNANLTLADGAQTASAIVILN